MITLISGTNRPDNNTIKLTQFYSELLTNKNVNNQILDLREMPSNFVYEEVFGDKSEAFLAIQDKYVYQVEKLIFVLPEYQGGFPGVFKSFWDAIDPFKIRGKKVAMVGLASGRAGNLRGLDHATNLAHYLQMHVLPQKVPVSLIDSILNEDGSINDEGTIKALNHQVEHFLGF